MNEDATTIRDIAEQRVGRESEYFQEVPGNVWLGGRDSNPDTQIQSLQSYH